jgi:5-methyltetrahydrofolate--homocysteine methyltransferase
MDDLIECGFQGFHPVQPNCMDIDAVKAKWGDSMCLLGNINLDSTLTLGSPQDVRAEVYERIRTIGPGGGYMVSSSNSVTDYVPVENMRAMFDATFEFGQYPIALDEGGVSGKVWKYQGKAEPKGSDRVDESDQPDELDVAGYMSALIDADETRVAELVEKDMAKGLNASDVISKGMIPAMTRIGEQFQAGKVFIPEMIVSAGAMAAVLSRFKHLLKGESGGSRGKIVIGTVKGDLHDVGKNLVVMMLEGQGYTVEDLGISVTPEKFVEAVKQSNPDILAMSALLTTTMVEMENTIDALQKAGVRDTVRIIVGGAPLTREFAKQIGADGYAYDSPGAVQKCDELLATS